MSKSGWVKPRWFNSSHFWFVLVFLNALFFRPIIYDATAMTVIIPSCYRGSVKNDFLVENIKSTDVNTSSYSVLPNLYEVPRIQIIFRDDLSGVLLDDGEVPRLFIGKDFKRRFSIEIESIAYLSTHRTTHILFSDNSLNLYSLDISFEINIITGMLQPSSFYDLKFKPIKLESLVNRLKWAMPFDKITKCFTDMESGND